MKSSNISIAVHPVEEQEFNLLTKDEFIENSFFLPGFLLEKQYSEIETRTFDTINTTSKSFFCYILKKSFSLNLDSSFNFGPSHLVQETQVQ